MTPQDMRDMLAYIKEHRISDTPFEVVRGGTTPGENRAKARAMLAPWIEVGLTWWIEHMRASPARCRKCDSVCVRVRPSYKLP